MNNLQYICKKCGKYVEHNFSFCPFCGVEFESGMTFRNAYKAGYEAAKNDIIKIIKGGKKNDIRTGY